MNFLPARSAETITILAHYYRGEMSRMISWRDRLDRTSNWAIGAVAAMLSISLASAQSHHSVLLFAMLLVHVLLYIEARRYRFFHVYRRRVVLLERRYFAEVFAPPSAGVPPDLQTLGEDLRLPRFTMTGLQAMARRLRRNYCWLFLVLLLAWLVKTTSAAATRHPRLEHSLEEFFANTAIAGISGAAIVAGVALLYVWLGLVMLLFQLDVSEMGPGEVHV